MNFGNTSDKKAQALLEDCGKYLVAQGWKAQKKHSAQ